MSILREENGKTRSQLEDSTRIALERQSNVDKLQQDSLSALIITLTSQIETSRFSCHSIESRTAGAGRLPAAP